MHNAEPEFDQLLVVAEKQTIATDVVSLVLRSQCGGALPSWSPGAHVDLILGDDTIRQYSLCGPTSEPSAYRIAVLLDPLGRGGSQWVHEQISEGDLVRVRGPRNHFPLVPAPRYLFIAGGIGITPILPMIDAVEGAGLPWRLVYGGRTRSSMAFADQLGDRHPDQVTLVPQDRSGLLDLDGLLGEPDSDTAVYCCGPEGLLAAVEKRCTRWPAGALHVERFSPKNGALDGPRTSFLVELAESGLTLTVPADRSILDVVEESGVFVMSSCQEGTCGTCETTVLAGVPEHRDSVLSPAEQESCKVMMVCVSRSRSERLVLAL